MDTEQWHDVPEDYRKQWQEAFNHASIHEGVRLSCPCPVCGAMALCRYYALQRLEPRQIDGVMYKGPGGYWEWCSQCRAYMHYSGVVPMWWNVPPLPIDHAKLAAAPDLLDDAFFLSK